MKHELIRTEKYILAVNGRGVRIGKYNIFIDNCNREIYAHLPLNGSTILEGVPLLPPLEDDVERLAKQELPISEFGESIENKREWNGFKKGHQKAREKYQNDLIKALMDFDLEIKKLLLKYSEIEHSLHARMCDDINDVRVKFIQSLQQPKYPIAFECEMERVFKHNEHMEREFYDVPKTFTNSEGRTEWVGKYIYE
jgi:hypothetical protein